MSLFFWPAKKTLGPFRIILLNPATGPEAGRRPSVFFWPVARSICFPGCAWISRMPGDRRSRVKINVSGALPPLLDVDLTSPWHGFRMKLVVQPNADMDCRFPNSHHGTDDQPCKPMLPAPPVPLPGAMWIPTWTNRCKRSVNSSIPCWG